MKKILIKNKLGVVTHQATMEDPAEWIEFQLSVEAWGRPERWVYLESPAFAGEDAAEALEIIEEEHIGLDGNPYWKTKYKFPADYTIEIIDITLEVEAEQAALEELQATQLAAAQRLQQLPAQLDEVSDLSGLKDLLKDFAQDIAVLLNK